MKYTKQIQQAMERCFPLLLVAAIFLSPCSDKQSASSEGQTISESKPNVIIVVRDDQGYREQGNTFYIYAEII